MTDLRLEGPVNILVLLGLTLPEVSEGDLAKIRAAAAPGSTIRVAPQVRDALAMAAEVEIILGFIPEALFHAAPRLHWVHAIAAGVDMFLYPAMRASHVVLTGEKGLVGGHLADTGFGLLLALTRQIATAIRLGPSSWQAREAMRRKEIELEGHRRLRGDRARHGPPGRGVRDARGSPRRVARAADGRSARSVETRPVG